MHKARWLVISVAMMFMVSACATTHNIINNMTRTDKIVTATLGCAAVGGGIGVPPGVTVSSTALTSPDTVLPPRSTIRTSGCVSK